MLIQIKIQNLVLIKTATISFVKGLNILTGETGAGKSAILCAIQLIAGERSDTHLIGKHGNIAIVEALVSNYTLPEDLPPMQPGEPLLIRREIHQSGKSRCFANDCQISLTTLRHIVGSSIELVDQASASVLLCLDEQRNMLDTFSNNIPLLKRVRESFTIQQTLEKQIETLLLAAETRNRDLSWSEEDLQMIETVNWQKGEELLLAQEHEMLTHTQERIQKTTQVLELLNSVSLKRAGALLEGCSRFDPSLLEFAHQLKNAHLEIEEVERSLTSYLNSMEEDPHRLTVVEERIAELESLKRRFGQTYDLVLSRKKELIEKIDQLKGLDEELSKLNSALFERREQTLSLAKQLSDQRKKQAPLFSKAIVKELHTLNLPNAQFQVSIQDAPLSSHGIDAIGFFFSANMGYSPIPIETCASGGERSRVLLAIKTTLANQEENSCIVFDEIDSNVGGQTASILGEKLKTIAHKKQVICITHFAQVAKCASTHFLVQKQEENGISQTTIKELSSQEKEQEYHRMLGSIQVPIESYTATT
jgi:DNA repair protein RecN (Recombination protein N)